MVTLMYCCTIEAHTHSHVHRHSEAQTLTQAIQNLMEILIKFVMPEFIIRDKGVESSDRDV